MPVLSGQAPAKVNLALKILERRPDGFHELRTVLQAISLADRLLVGYTRGGRARIRLRCNDSALEGPQNLAARAARELLDAGSWKGQVNVTLEKRIPVGAGLGGGSSDAAGVLLALRRLLKPRPPAALLLQVAASLGSDVPYFLVGGTALGIGRGEEVYPLPDHPQRWLLLLVPEIRISTPEAYRELSRDRSPLTPASRRNIINGFCSGVSVSENREGEDLAGTPLPCFENDFEAVVFRQHPALKNWKRKLLRSGASRAMLSGSGSALFGVFSDRRRALEARAAFDAFPGKVSVVRTLTRRSYQRLWKS
jgi:4-diphosphocytidyl-2-C-methyl-D-erythritol kinase